MLEGIVLHVGIAVQSTLRTAIRSRVAHAAADGRRGLRERQHGVAAAATAQTDGRTDGRTDGVPCGSVGLGNILRRRTTRSHTNVAVAVAQRTYLPRNIF